MFFLGLPPALLPRNFSSVLALLLFSSHSPSKKKTTKKTPNKTQTPLYHSPYSRWVFPCTVVWHPRMWVSWRRHIAHGHCRAKPSVAAECLDTKSSPPAKKSSHSQLCSRTCAPPHLLHSPSPEQKKNMNPERNLKTRPKQKCY